MHRTPGAMLAATRPSCAAIGQRRVGLAARSGLPLRRPSIMARVAAIEPVAPARDENGFALKEVCVDTRAQSLSWRACTPLEGPVPGEAARTNHTE